MWTSRDECCLHSLSVCPQTQPYIPDSDEAITPLQDPGSLSLDFHLVWGNDFAGSFQFCSNYPPALLPWDMHQLFNLLWQIFILRKDLEILCAAHSNELPAKIRKASKLKPPAQLWGMYGKEPLSSIEPNKYFP